MTDLLATVINFAGQRPDLLAMASAAAALAVVASLLVSANARQRTVRRRLLVDLPGARPPAADSAGDDPLAAIAAGDTSSHLSPMLDKFLSQAAGVLQAGDAGKLRLARQRMIQAGFFSPHAVTLFFLSRVAGAVLVPLAVLLLLLELGAHPQPTTRLLFLLIATIAGYLGPSLYVDKCAKAVLRDNRIAFPDFMDLMGVCANAGLSMEAGLERVTKELAPMYPALGVNLQVLCLEVRAGRPIELALQTMADRVGVPEVRAFATLLQQSRELGSSLSDALRVFSEDMRHQRLAAAEEKAYALPAKLSVPVTACILPVVIFIAIWPVVVKFNS